MHLNKIKLKTVEISCKLKMVKLEICVSKKSLMIENLVDQFNNLWQYQGVNLDYLTGLNTMLKVLSGHICSCK